ncbi:MAG: UvrD-helicase domain-containing protein, partial [Chlamydiia bacterium]|nr:UvrD-helicase domain-containing protein [Chlamydiia bacterium]
VTFTNKAAGEMQERVAALTHSRVQVTTFHSLGARILRESGHYLGLDRTFAIYDENDTEKLLKEVLKEHELSEARQIKILRNKISAAKNAMQGPGDVKDVLGQGHVVWKFPEVYAEYERRLRAYNAVDFDDLLYLVVRLFREVPAARDYYAKRWWHVLVDEYQDTNASQYEMIRFLVAEHHNICVVGDPDQSIYSWRGADISNILGFEEDFPGAKIVRLEQNYRSTQTILDAANALIAHNSQRYEKNLWSAQGVGEKIHVYEGASERQEGAFVLSELLHRYQEDKVPLKDIALLYRTNAQSRHFEDIFLAEGIPYVVVGGVSFYQRREIKDILSYLRVVQSSADFISFDRTINLPKRGVGPTTIDRLHALADAQAMPILDLCALVLEDSSDLAKQVKLNKKQKQGLTDYLSLIRDVRAMLESSAVSHVVRSVMHRSGYLDYLRTDPETVQDRVENLDELVHKAQEWEMAQAKPTLSAFLEELSLKANIDDKDLNQDRVNLMTLHNSKGLEFDTVFLTGLEEDVLPHSRSDITALEEERRLCYVGMTRAKRRLFLTHVSRRFVRGSDHYMQPSRFLFEVPSEYTDVPDDHDEVEDSYDYSADYSQEASSEGLHKGSVVMHQVFGIGVIQDA